MEMYSKYKKLDAKKSSEKLCIYLINDIKAFSPYFKKHLVNLVEVLIRLKNPNLKIKLEKRKYVMLEVKMLGHLVSSQGIHP